MQEITIASLSAFVLLGVALLLAAFGYRRQALGAALPSLAAAFYAGVLGPLALAWLPLAGGVLWAMQRWPHRHWGGVALLLLVLALALHKLPGVHNLPLWQGRLDLSMAPYALWWNFDKGLAGLMLLLALPEWRGAHAAPHRLWLGAVAALAAALLLALGGGLVAWAPKWPAWLPAWGFANLLLVSLPEEALFRRAAAHLLGRWGVPAVLLGSSLLFGLAHLPGGMVWALVAGLAGLGYGLAYLASGRVWVAALVHLGFNTLHLLGFSYPQLA